MEVEQESLLSSALKIVKNESFEMRRAVDKNQLMEALKHAVQMLSELRTSLLTPKFYYRLYVDVTTELQHFLSILSDIYLTEDRTRIVSELYETVQYTGNIIPRLYLLITVGVLYIKSGESSAIDILLDLVEMCRGVQHPLRGLFLRNYLLTSAKELIPDRASRGLTEDNILSHPNEGSIEDAVEFIMANFSEMNKLWVRMQHQGPSKEREKRERERKELRILVGTNLVRLSQLENLNFELYQRIVLPRILEQSVSSKEPISQEYLMECIIQVFPDNFHMKTLNEFLNACAELHNEVRIKNILTALIDHLTIYASSEKALNDFQEKLPLFEIFSTYSEKIISAQKQISLEDIISIQIALINLALNCYKENTELANSVFTMTLNIFDKLKISQVNFKSVFGREFVKLLKMPIDSYKDVHRLIQLSSFGKVMYSMDLRGKIHVSSYLIKDMLENKTTIDDEDTMDKILYYIEPLLTDNDSDLNVDDKKQISDEKCDQNDLPDNFEESQNLVAKLIHLIYNDDLRTHFKLLTQARKVFGTAGKKKLRYTLPSLIFTTLRLIMRSSRSELEGMETLYGKLFHFCMSTINALRLQAEMPEMALRFYLQGALLANNLDFEKSSIITYEFISEAFSVYEEEISESREQVQSLTLLIAILAQVKLLDENHEPLRNRCLLHASKLLKRTDQTIMLCLVARLFWFSKIIRGSESTEVRNADGVIECLKKASNVSAQCMEELVQCQLGLHILNTYIFFLTEKCTEISIESIEHALQKMKDQIHQLDPCTEAAHILEDYTRLIKSFNLIKDGQ